MKSRELKDLMRLHSIDLAGMVVRADIELAEAKQQGRDEQRESDANLFDGDFSQLQYEICKKIRANK